MKTNFKNKSWKGTQKMSELNLSLKNLTVLPNNMEDFENLTALYLYVNKLEELPETIGNLKNLSVLNLGFNKLRELPDSIGNLENLAELGFNSNQLEMLPDSIGNLKNLSVLDLHGNQLKELPESVKELASNLKEDIEEISLFDKEKANILNSFEVIPSAKEFKPLEVANIKTFLDFHQDKKVTILAKNDILLRAENIGDREFVKSELIVNLISKKEIILSLNNQLKKEKEKNLQSYWTSLKRVIW